MTGNQDIMYSFTLISNSIVLAGDSHTPIQGIGTIATTPTFLLSFVFYLSYFSFNPIMSK